MKLCISSFGDADKTGLAFLISGVADSIELAGCGVADDAFGGCDGDICAGGPPRLMSCHALLVTCSFDEAISSSPDSRLRMSHARFAVPVTCLPFEESRTSKSIAKVTRHSDPLSFSTSGSFETV